MGSGKAGYGQKIIRLSEEAVDITPSHARPSDLDDLDGDGKPELIADQDYWGLSVHTCGACGVSVPAVLVWREGAFIDACRQFPEYYDKLIAERKVKLPSLKRQIKNTNEIEANNAFANFLSLSVANSLYLYQSGRFKEACLSA